MERKVVANNATISLNHYYSYHIVQNKNSHTETRRGLFCLPSKGRKTSYKVYFKRETINYIAIEFLLQT